MAADVEACILQWLASQGFPTDSQAIMGGNATLPPLIACQRANREKLLTTLCSLIISVPYRSTTVVSVHGEGCIKTP